MNEKLNVLLVDDEELARDLLKSYLKGHEKVQLIGECENGFEGVQKINELKPDLVFLDIQMPKITGFEMLQLLDHKPEIIFTTAYDQYALKAFEINAVDYLLKPFSKERMCAAIDKVVERRGQAQEQSQRISRLSEYADEEYLDRVVVKDRHRIHIIPIEQIRYIESMDDYVLIYTDEGRQMKQNTMKFFESHLDPHEFIRIHRSYIVRVSQIEEIQQYEKESYVVILKDKTKLKVSKSGYKNLKEALDF
ncbi:LytTR family transcriptional regulator DNA-binding domain-containing protein [Mangrovibacterium marinum]|uniref:LytR/AlgR family response regulator transcription factor n=1 Tax=Mangrovibacterium marinum TaxID=1639118 RepID=UPI002A18C945|nr:LytTR family transcriptional regulator DNA-binding domain-containing protein [Mangrovibacterium marinum]